MNLKPYHIPLLLITCIMLAVTLGCITQLLTDCWYAILNL